MKKIFPVAEQKVYTSEGKEIPGKKAIVRTDTRTVLSIMSSSYKLVKHQEVLSSVSKAMSVLKLEELRCSLCKQGAVMLASYYGKGVSYGGEVSQGDIVRFGIQVFNSYDGSLPVGIMLIAERLKCMNGMVVPETISRFAVKHYGGLDLGSVKRKADEILGLHSTIITRYRSWGSTKLTEEAGRGFFNKSFGKRERELLYRRYESEKEDNTVWGLYCFITKWLTHELKVRKGNEENRGLLQLGRGNYLTTKMVQMFPVGKEV